MDVADRSARLRARLADVPCDALLVTNLTNIRYLTGFTGSAALLLVPADEARELVFVTDGRYRDQAAAEVAAAGAEARIEIGREEEARRQVLADAVVGMGRLGLESENVTWGQKRRFDDDWFPEAKLVRTSGLVESLRLVKDAGEVARIQAACAIADAALAAVRHRLGEGATEAEVALELEWHMRRLGAEGPSFDTVVASGAEASAVDEVCRAILRDAGWEEAFLHGTGHGVGLDIHEAPRVAANAAGSLADGHVVTVEPGVYLAEHGGVRIEDTVVVTAEGCRTLTLAPKDPSL